MLPSLTTKFQNRFILAIYLIAGTALYFPLRFFLDCNDTLEYIAIAGNYASGNLHDALNSYWSPLFSWLLTPFIKFGLQGLFAAKIVEIIIGFFTLQLLLMHIDKQPSGKLTIIFKLSAIPLILGFALMNNSPDLLVVCWMLYLALKLGNAAEYFSSLKPALLCGFVGALFYFTKAFGLIFFPLIFSTVHLYYFLKGNVSLRKNIIRNYTCGIIIFLMLSGAWVFAISQKYNHCTIGYSGTYNFRIIGPEINPDVFSELNHPFFMGKLFSSPNPHAINAWEDPEVVLLPAWNPFHTKAELVHYGKIIGRNLLSVRSFNFGADTGTLLLLGFLLLCILEKRIVLRLFPYHVLLFLFSIITTGIYMLVFVMHRYIWINDVFILIVSATIASLLWNKNKFIASGFSILFLLLVIRQSAGEIKEKLGDGWDLYSSGLSLAGEGKMKGVIASLENDSTLTFENYDYSSQLAAMTGNFYAGMLKATGQKDICSDLEKYGVKYIFTWGKAPDPTALTHGRAKAWKNIRELELRIFIFE